MTRNKKLRAIRNNAKYILHQACHNQDFQHCHHHLRKIYIRTSLQDIEVRVNFETRHQHFTWNTSFYIPLLNFTDSCLFWWQPKSTSCDVRTHRKKNWPWKYTYWSVIVVKSVKYVKILFYVLQYQIQIILVCLQQWFDHD